MARQRDAQLLAEIEAADDPMLAALRRLASQPGEADPAAAVQDQSKGGRGV